MTPQRLLPSLPVLLLSLAATSCGGDSAAGSQKSGRATSKPVEGTSSKPSGTEPTTKAELPDPEVLTLPTRDAPRYIGNGRAPIVLDVNASGELSYQGQHCAVAAGEEGKPLVEMLKEIRASLPADEAREVNLGGSTLQVADNPVVVRMDEMARVAVIGEIMKQCSQRDVALWNIHLAVDDGEGLGCYPISLLPVPRKGNAEPVESLEIQITVLDEGKLELDRWQGRNLSWSIGPRRMRELKEVDKQLQRIYEEPYAQQDNPENPGQKVPMRAIASPSAKLTYGELAACLELIVRHQGGEPRIALSTPR